MGGDMMRGVTGLGSAAEASPRSEAARKTMAGAETSARTHATRTDRELMKACEELESVFLEQLLKEMRKTVPKDDLFGGGRGEDVFQSMFDQEIAKAMAGRGGIGLAEILYKQLSRRAATPSQLGGHRLDGPRGANEAKEG
ncbi:MAG: rod-binding protein [Betaproteobacteria bacterium]